MNDTLKQRAWVVFTNQTELKVLRLFKRGFRHCFVLLHDGERWISIDPMSHVMEVKVHCTDGDFDLPQWLQQRGHRVLRAPMPNALRRPAPTMVFTCVEACKRVLGIRKRWIFTPWQLYRHLTRSRLFT